MSEGSLSRPRAPRTPHDAAPGQRGLRARLPGSARRAASGLTLVELLMVIGLVALIFGIGLGMFSTLDLESRSVISRVQSVIRAANNWSVARGAPARVLIDPVAGTLRAEGIAVVGTWHFEELPVKGAFDLEGSNFGAELDEDGFQGRALSFAGQRGANVEIAVQHDAAWDFREGFALRCALRPYDLAAGRVLAIGQTIGLDVTGDGGLEAWFVALREEEGRESESTRVILQSEPGVLAEGRWTRVAVRYDRRRFDIEVEGVPVAAVEETAQVWTVEGPLSLSSRHMHFRGSLDNLVVAAVGADEAVALPPGFQFVKGTPLEIAFAPGGGLDRAVHGQPVTLEIDFEDGKRHTVEVGLYGTVQ